MTVTRSTYYYYLFHHVLIWIRILIAANISNQDRADGHWNWKQSQFKNEEGSKWVKLHCPVLSIPVDNISSMLAMTSHDLRQLENVPCIATPPKRYLNRVDIRCFRTNTTFGKHYRDGLMDICMKKEFTSCHCGSHKQVQRTETNLKVCSQHGAGVWPDSWVWDTKIPYQHALLRSQPLCLQPSFLLIRSLWAYRLWLMLVSQSPGPPRLSSRFLPRSLPGPL